MKQSLASNEYANVHIETVGVFNISTVHHKAVTCTSENNFLNKEILDLGCGNGELLFLLKERGATIYGIDYEEKSIKTAQNRLENSTNIQLGDIIKTPYPDNYFNFVFSLGTIGYLSKSDLKKTSGEMFRVLKPGGKVIIRTATFSNKIGKFLLKIKNRKYRSNTHFYKLKTYKKIFRESGFKIENIERSIDSATTNFFKQLLLKLLKPFLSSTWIILKK